MRPVMTAGTLLAVLSTLPLAVSPSLSEAAGMKIGEPFPDLSFPSLDGGAPASLADFRGQRVVLHVFASW